MPDLSLAYCTKTDLMLVSQFLPFSRQRLQQLTRLRLLDPKVANAIAALNHYLVCLVQRRFNGLSGRLILGETIGRRLEAEN
ncbi:hypothetical protein, partial [Lysobacter sp. A3-1-A15]|uniref:hypothetical protein n=1 Tax=Novilysobacter viscosus TaxID=3098602 RepID=UPI002EDA2363